MSPLVLVHGFMGGAAQWDGLRADLSDTFDSIALDLPGFGANNHLPVIDTIGGFADWMIAALRARGVNRYHLLGHSMGGMIVQEMVRRDAHNIDSLVLYGTGAVGVLPGRFETIPQSKARAQSDGTRTTARRISATWFLEQADAPAYPACAALAEQSADAALPAGLDAMEHWSGAEALADIKVDTLVIWGDRDRTYAWAQPERLWQTIPGASLAVVPGCAHAVHLEKPALFHALLRDFLTDKA